MPAWAPITEGTVEMNRITILLEDGTEFELVEDGSYDNEADLKYSKVLGDRSGVVSDRGVKAKKVDSSSK